MTEKQPESVEWKRQIEALQDEARQAFLAQDVTRLGALFSDDLLVNSPINCIHDKRQVLDLLQKGIIRHFSMEEHVETIRRHGEFVIVMGGDVVTNAPDGPPVRRRFTNIWQAAGDTWLLIARHAQATAATP